MIPRLVKIFTLPGLLFFLQAGLFVPAQPEIRPGCSAPKGPPRPLGRGEVLECGLAPAQKHSYRLSLQAGELLHVRVEQRGIDVGVSLFGPKGQSLLHMDSPNGRRGEEPVLAIAETAGDYLLQLTGADRGWHGTYLLVLQDVRPATTQDRARVRALALMAEGDDFKRQKKKEQALQKYREAIATSASVQDPWGQVLSLERLGKVLTDERRFSEALTAFSQGLSLAHKSGDRLAETALANRAGLVERELGHLDKARFLFERSLTLAEQIGYVEGQAQAHNNLGLLAEAQFKVTEGLTHYQAALALWPRVDEPAQEALTYTNLGELFLAADQPEEALAVFNKARILLKREARPEVLYSVLDGAGMAYHSLGLRERSILFFLKALNVANTPQHEARTLSRLGTVYRDERRFSDATAALENARRIAQQERDRRREGIAQADLAHIANLEGRDEEALRRFDQACSLLKDQPEAAPFFGRAEVLRDLGRLDEAIASVEESIRLVESIRSEMATAEQRVSFFSYRHQYYELYVDLLRRDRKAGGQARAFEASERARARTLLDDVAGAPFSKPLKLEEIQRELLDRDAMLLVYALGEKKSFLWVVEADGLVTLDLPPREVIESAVLRAWRQLSESGDGPDVAGLSRMLLPAGVGPLDRKRILVSPDGLLDHIPFSSLHDSRGNRLFVEHEVTHLPSASFLVGMRRKLANRLMAPKQLAVLADSVFQRNDPRFPDFAEHELEEEKIGDELTGGRLSRLLFSRQEAEAILHLVPAEDRFQAFDFDANKTTAVAPRLARYRILHFATHSVLGSHPDLTGLVFSRFDAQGRRQDGFLRATEIYNLHFPVELVVLSACGTGLGTEIQGEGPVGLTRAFLHAGARRVVVSLWSVEEGATTELMTRFYRAMLQDGLSPAAALRSAQLSMATDRRWRSSPSWAAFVLQGEPD